MNSGGGVRRWMCPLALAILALLVTSQSAFSQGCALCYTQAASSGTRMIDALRSGILILIVPPTLMTLVVFGVCYRKRNDFQDTDFTSETDSSW
jgi:hypothetical protein